MKLDNTTINTLRMGQSRNFEVAGGKVGRSRHKCSEVTLRRDTPKKPVTKLSAFNENKQ